jgi:hypothetical protein
MIIFFLFSACTDPPTVLYAVLHIDIVQSDSLVTYDCNSEFYSVGDKSQLKLLSSNPAHIYGVLDTTLRDQVCQRFETVRYLSPGTLVSFTATI